MYPHLLERVCSTSAIMAERVRWLARARGEVLEVGVGSGLNLPLLDPQHITSFVGLDPSPPLLARAAARISRVPTTLVAGTAEALPFDGARFDTVLLTYTLCSVDDPARALAEIRRVLRPGGVLVFVEHGAATKPRTLRWQHRLTPLWRLVSGNCHLDRDVPRLLEAAGLTVTELDGRDSDASPLSYAYSGIARATG
ncbi:MAG: phospholipid methyltransferase [Myxococcales bacterium]|nr:phospholipid methyltransferase [Myxococcales bacterium]